MRSDVPRKKSLANIAERTLDLTLGLGSIWPAGTRLEAVMPRKVEKGAVVNDKTIRVFPDRRANLAFSINVIGSRRFGIQPGQASI